MKVQTQKAVSSKTTMIKARLANQLRKMFYKKDLKKISALEKDIYFETIFKLTKEMHIELNDYKAKRKHKASIEKLREERGVKRKKKTSKEEYLKSLNNKLKVV